jgi:ubiquinone/menaquinone biosynthesis C-methylase UbiE
MVATVESSYGRDAEFYDRRTSAFQSDRLRIIDALPLRAGDLVLDVGCGTGLCFEGLRDRVGAMASAGHDRIRRDRIRRVTATSCVDSHLASLWCTC